MKRVLVTVEFVLRDENGLHEMTEEELATKVRDLFEDDHYGYHSLAKYGSAGVMALMAREE